MNGKTAKKKTAYEKSAIALLICICVITIFALQLHSVVAQVRQAILNGHWVELVHSVNLIAKQIDEFIAQDQDWGVYDYARNLRSIAELLGSRRGVFCELFNDSGEMLSKNSTLAGEYVELPFESEQFRYAIENDDRGEVPLTIYSATMGKNIDTKGYFRRIPSGIQKDKLLIVIAMSPDVLTGDPAERLVNWCAAMLATSGAVMIVSGVLITLRRRSEEATDA